MWRFVHLFFSSRGFGKQGFQCQGNTCMCVWSGAAWYYSFVWPKGQKPSSVILMSRVTLKSRKVVQWFDSWVSSQRPSFLCKNCARLKPSLHMEMRHLHSKTSHIFKSFIFFLRRAQPSARKQIVCYLDAYWEKKKKKTLYKLNFEMFP